MARIKSKRNTQAALSCSFGGLGKHTPLSPLGAEDMCNFRILPNGTLKVRSGYTRKKHFSSGKKVRGIWEGNLEGKSFFFAVVGNTVYSLSKDTMAESPVGTVTDGTENVHFFFYEDVLYLLDGTKMWTYSASAKKFEELEAYVPLYGYAWSPSSFGDIKEDVNVLTPRLRVHYYNPNAETEFTLPYYASSIEFVIANGKETYNYNFTKGSNKIVFPTAPVLVEIGFTVSLNEELRASVLASQMSYIYSRNGTNQLFLWGKNAHLYFVKSVTPEMLSSCRSFFPKASPLYMGGDDAFILGDSTHPITAICPLYETLLIFTSDRIWNLAFEKEGMQVTLAMSGIGCASPHGAIPHLDGVLAAMDGGIYNITASPARPEDLFLERISLSVDEKFPAGFCDRVHLLRNFPNGEVWMRDPTETSGEVWVWNAELKDWYRFGKIAASFFFKTAEGIGFASESDIHFFERSATTDNGSAIDAYYKSTYLDFGVPDAPRRSMRAFLYAAPGGSDCDILFETEQKEQLHQFFAPTDAKAPQLHDMRIATHRYRFLRFTLSTGAKKPTEFYKLDIFTRP